MYYQNSKCEECETATSEVYCVECEQYLCVLCNSNIHSGGNRKAHKRVSISKSSKETANIKSNETSENSKIQEPKIMLASYSNQNKTAIYWDLPKIFPSIIELKETIMDLKIRYPSLISIKAYGQVHISYENLLNDNGIELRICNNLKDIDAMILDISLDHQKYSKILIISPRAYQFKSHIQQILTNSIKVNIKISLSYTEIRELSVESINSHLDPNNGRVAENKSFLKDIETNKPIRRRAAASEDCLESSMITYLKEQALEGKIMHEFDDLKENLRKYFKISSDNAHELIKTAVKFEKLHLQNKKIGKIELKFLSRKIEKLTSESLLCVLRSLRNDEMIPTEKAIYSRFKEVYDINTPNIQLSNILELCRRSQQEKSFFHKKASSDTSSFSLFSQNDCKKIKNFSFCIKKIKDYATDTEINAIYPTNEE